METHTAIEDAVIPTDSTLRVSDPASLRGSQFTNDLRQKHVLNHTTSNQHNPEYRLLCRTNDLASSAHRFQGKKRDDLKDILKLYQLIATCGSYFDPTTKCQKKKNNCKFEIVEIGHCPVETGHLIILRKYSFLW